MSARLEGAKMRTAWPCWRSWRARCCTWSVTPPGEAKSYGETSPIFIRIPPVAGRAFSWRAFPNAVWHVPLLGMAPDERFDLAQNLLRRPNLVAHGIPRVLGEDQRSALCLVAVVRKPVYAHREKWGPKTQRDRGGPQGNRRRPAEERHPMAGAGDVAVDRGDHHLLVVQRLEDLE